MALMEVGGPHHIVDTNLPVPEPAADEVLIRVRTVAVNHQDRFTMSGRAHKANLSFPHVMGIDPSGVVAGRGSQVTSLAIGQRVVVKPPIACGACSFCIQDMDDSCPSLHNVGVHRWGGHAEYVTVPERSVFPIAPGLSHVKASALAHSFPVAEQMFTRVGLSGDDVVLVAGASGAIGSAAVQLAKLAGAFVIGAAGSPDRAARAAAAGADATIDYTSEPDFSGRARSLVPEGVTVFLDPASNPQVWNEVLKTLRNRARVVVCGSHAGPMVELNNNWLFRSRVAIYGSSGSTRRGMRRCIDLAAAGGIRPAIDSVRPLGGIREAYADLGSRRNIGKIVLRVSGGDNPAGG